MNNEFKYWKASAGLYIVNGSMGANFNGLIQLRKLYNRQMNYIVGRHRRCEYINWIFAGPVRCGLAKQHGGSHGVIA